jgi:hypothetical protein
VPYCQFKNKFKNKQKNILTYKAKKAYYAFNKTKKINLSMRAIGPVRQ